MIDVVTDLPRCLSGALLSEWIEMADLSRLDSAYCSHGRRDGFLAIMSSDELVYKDQAVPHLQRELLWSWVIGRDIKLSQISNSAASDGDEELTNYVTKYERYISNLVVGANSGIFAHQCKHLVCLSCDFRYGGENLAVLFRNNPNLREMALDGLCEEHTALFDGVNLEQLTKLNIMFSSYSRSCFEAVLSMPMHLLKLEVWDVGADSLGISKLCPHLRTLMVCASLLLELDLRDFTSHCPRIVNLKLFENTLLTDEQLLGVVRNLKELRALEIHHDDVGFSFTDVGIGYIAEYCAETLELFHIHLPICGVDIAHESLDLLRARCTQLRSFRCIDTFNGFYIPNSSATALRVNVICTEELLAAIAVACPVVEILQFRHGVYSCPISSMRKLCQDCPRLNSLIISNHLMRWPKLLVSRVLTKVPQLRLRTTLYDFEMMDLPA